MNFFAAVAFFGAADFFAAAAFFGEALALAFGAAFLPAVVVFFAADFDFVAAAFVVLAISIVSVLPFGTLTGIPSSCPLCGSQSVAWHGDFTKS